MNIQATLSPNTVDEAMNMPDFLMNNWESDDEDDGNGDDSVLVIQEDLIKAKSIPTNLVKSPAAGENEYDFPIMVKGPAPVPTATKQLAHPEQTNQEVLHRLMRRYKKFIPKSLPPPRKRAGPLCLFINNHAPPQPSTCTVNIQATLLSDTEEEVLHMSDFLMKNWESDDEDDGDSFQVIPAYLIKAKGIPTSLVSSATGENKYDFPIIVKEPEPVPTATKQLAHPEETNQEVLDRLMQRYKKFIPQSLPPLRKRAGPLCLFINYLGTRRVFIPAPTGVGVASLAPMAAAEEEPSYYPTDPPSGYGSRGATMAPPSKRRKISLDPTLQPSENYYM
jgi:hypothetical protein